MEMKHSRLVCITWGGAHENGIEALPHYLHKGWINGNGIEALTPNLHYGVVGAIENGIEAFPPRMNYGEVVLVNAIKRSRLLCITGLR
jgi:hypothetical protein